MATEYNDITRTGTGGLKGLPGISQSDVMKEMQMEMQSIRSMSPEMAISPYMAKGVQSIGFQLGESDYGNSIYDDNVISTSQLDDLNEVRALNQPWYSKLTSGALKAFTTAGTTIIDGTAGLLYGVGKGIYDAYNSEDGKGWQAFGNALSNNELSQELRKFTAMMEEVLPNYRTKDEIENPYALRNIFSMNTFADDFLKNMGFTVGAFYSGNAFLGALKAMKIGGMMSSTAARTIGSVVSGLNEGRIEAGNMYDEMIKAEEENLMREYRPLYEQIMAEPDTLVRDPETGIAISSRQLKLQQLQDNLEKSRKNIEDRAQKGAIADLIMNTAYLPFADAYAYGKLYARGFKTKKGLASNVGKRAIDEAAQREAIQETLGNRILRQGKEYVTNPVTRKQATWKGFKIGVSEGLEEGNQSFFSALGANTYAPDSPDSYYESLIDPEYQMQSKDLLSALPEAWKDSWGGKDVWKEVGIGFLTGIIGMPTFGRVNNSDHNTYLGRGKMVGLSGGMFGEISNANYLNREAEGAVNAMNTLINKVDNADRFFTRSQAFTDAMDGWVEADDKFEFESASDNDLFNAIDAFGRTGRLKDLREIIGQDFENISDEELSDIATNTTGETNEWLNSDGTSMADTELGRQKMREKLTQKRDNILSSIDSYEEALEEVRAIGNNALDEDQVRELAWLKWKIGKFEDRFKSIKEDNSEGISDLNRAVTAFLGGRGQGIIDENSEEGKIIMDNMRVLSSFLNLLNNSKSPLQVSTLMKSAEETKLLNFFNNFGFDIIEGMTGLDSQAFSDLMNNLRDTIRLSNASDSFNNRYKEFMNDPLKLIQNRDNIDKRKSNLNSAKDDLSSVDKVRNSSVSDLASAMRDGSFDTDAFDSILDGLEGEDVEEQKKKVQEAQAINDGSDQLSQAINAAELEGIDPLEMEAVKRDAQALLSAATESAESLDDLFNTDTEAWLDPRNLPVGEDESVNLEEAQERLDAARSLVQQQLAQVKDAAEVMSQVPKSGQSQPVPGTGTTGHDPVDKTITENERKKKEEEAAAKREVKVDRTTAYHKGVAELTAGMPDAVRDRYQQLASHLLTDLDMLLNKGLSNEEIASVLSASTTYKDLNAANPLINNLLNDYINAFRSEVAQPKTSTSQPTPRIITPVIEAGNTMAVQPPSADIGSSKVGGMYMFLRPSTTELPIHYNGGAITPYHELVKDTGQYTESELQRMKAVYEYLENHGAFQRVNEGRVKPGDTVGFMIDPALNEKAGDTVILITDKDGKVIGDLPARNSRTFGEYAGLAELVDRIEREYKETGKVTATTQVDKNFVGKVPTVDTYSTLNAISEGKGFTLGIALEGGNMPSIIIEGGRTKKTRGDRDNQAIRPANAAAGQPFLMLETSSPTRHYYPVPILMKSFGESTQGTQLHKAVEDAVSSIVNKASRPTEVKDDLLDVLALEDAYVEYNGDEVKLRVKKPGQGWEEVFKGVPTPDTLQQVLQKLEGTPYQVSRKYINGEYKGQSYNDMIGEIAEANLPIGTRHTVSDWFSLKLTNGQKTISPRTRGENPHRAASVFVTVNYKGTPLTVDTKSWEVSDSTGKVYNGDRADKVKAYAWGLHTNQDMTKLYVSKWGKFDPVKGDFVKSNPVTAQIDDSLLAGLAEAQADFESFIASREAETPPVSQTPSRPTGQPIPSISPRDNAKVPNSEVDELSAEEAKKKVADAGLLNTPIRQSAWDWMGIEAQRMIAAKAGKPKATQWMDALGKVFDPKTMTFDLNKLAGKPKSIEEYLSSKPKFERADRADREWNETKERQWIEQALPQLSTDDRLRVHNGLIRISEKDGGGEAYGQFWNGVITIASNAAQGTLYHEAFHAVADALLNNQEHDLLFKAAEEKWGNIGMLALEEKMADDFRKYVQLEETPILGKAVKAYRTLKHIVQNLFGKEPFINKVYYNISRGKYSNRVLNDSPNTDVKYMMAEGFRGTVGEFQSIVDNMVNNPVVNHTRVAMNTSWGRLRNFWRTEGYEVKGYFKNGKWNVASATPVSKYRRITANEVAQYHRDKLSYGNLEATDRQYLEDRGITKEDYNNMSQKEKEVLFHCR